MSAPRVVVLCPRRADGGHRDRLWSHVRAHWAEHLPELPVYEGHHDDGPFNRSAAVNRAAEAAGGWDAALVIDADTLPDAGGVGAAVAHALRTGGLGAAHTGRRNLDRRGTEKVLAGYRGSWEALAESSHPLCVSGALAVRRDTWDAVGGFDELFVGWGFEDTAFEIACEAVSGLEVWKSPADLWHLWHPKSPEHDPRKPGFKANRARRERYSFARGDLAALTPLFDEARAAKAGRPPAAELTAGDRVPRILHRTVPERPSEEAEAFWLKARDLHPGWGAMDHRDPLDPREWPETGALWGLCTSGAQKAGLVRLEALWRWGGVYVDSDVELYRSLEPLTSLEGFAAWEDRRCVPDAVLGFRRGHPALAEMLAAATEAVRAGKGAWDSGPGVTTRTLPGRGDVLLLPPGSFYPYHYSTKDRDRGRDHAAEQPWAFGAHHWAHSWKGK